MRERYRSAHRLYDCKAFAIGLDEIDAHLFEDLANTLTNRLLHAPTAHLRQASQEGRAELIIAARSLYGIDDDDWGDEE